MNFVREIIDGEKVATIIDIPNEFKNQQVEVLIFPIIRTKKEKPKSKFKNSLSGKFSKYANPELRKKEDTAWYEAAHEWKLLIPI